MLHCTSFLNKLKIILSDVTLAGRDKHNIVQSFDIDYVPTVI